MKVLEATIEVTETTRLHSWHLEHVAHSERWLPTMLSVIAGMVDLIGFLSLGIFTAHITGNIVVIGALVVRHNRVNPAQILAIPVFILAVAGTWLLARASGRSGPGLLRLLLLVQFLLLTCVLIFSVSTKPSANPDGLIGCIAAMMAVSAMACNFANTAIDSRPHGAIKCLAAPPRRLFRRIRCCRRSRHVSGRLGLVTSSRAGRGAGCCAHERRKLVIEMRGQPQVSSKQTAQTQKRLDELSKRRPEVHPAVTIVYRLCTRRRV